jgi:hypothetical protein
MAEVFHGGIYQDMEVDEIKEVRSRKSEVRIRECGVWSIKKNHSDT